MDNNEEKLVPQFIPALVVILKAAEDKKGSPLTEQEVIEFRDASACIMLPLSVRETLNISRSYSDIDPENCWAEWCEARKEF